MKPVATMSRTQIKAEMKSNSAKQSKLNDKLIADGFGSFSTNDLARKGNIDALAIVALCDRYCSLTLEEERIYLGYRKATITRLDATTALSTY